MWYYFDNGNEAKGMSAVAVCFLALLPLAVPPSLFGGAKMLNNMPGCDSARENCG